MSTADISNHDRPWVLPEGWKDLISRFEEQYKIGVCINRTTLTFHNLEDYTKFIAFLVRNEEYPDDFKGHYASVHTAPWGNSVTLNFKYSEWKPPPFD